MEGVQCVYNMGTTSSSAGSGGMSSSDTQTYQSIIAQQAQPLTQLAAQLHTANLERAWSGEFNEWIEKSFAAMRELNPARFAKDELIVSYGDEIR